MRPVDAPAGRETQLDEEWHLECELQETAHEDRPGEHQYRWLEIVGKENAADNECNVEKRRGDRRNGETAPGVENAGGKRDQCDEEDVGEGDAQQRHRQVERLCRIKRKP